MLEHIGFLLSVNIANLRKDLWNLKKTIGWWFLIIRYRGRENIPQDVVGKHWLGDMTKEEELEMINTMKVTSAIIDIAKFMGKENFLEYKICAPVGRFLRGENPNAQEFDRVNSVRYAKNVKEAVLYYMKELGDITTRDIVRLGDDEKFLKWINNEKE
jgi:hypothetical protein